MAQGDQATRPMNFQVPEEMRTMAERSVTQARQALERKPLLQQRPHDPPPWRPSSQPSIESNGARWIQSLTALSPIPSPDCPGARRGRFSFGPLSSGVKTRNL